MNFLKQKKGILFTVSQGISAKVPPFLFRISQEKTFFEQW